jgi:hypothetical protein
MDIFAPVPNVRAATRSFACFLVWRERASAPAVWMASKNALLLGGEGGECFEDCLKVLLCWSLPDIVHHIAVCLVYKICTSIYRRMTFTYFVYVFRLGYIVRPVDLAHIAIACTFA